MRPWCLVIEATVPQKTTPSHRVWHGLLKDARYKFVYFDGLNRFYLAEEQLALKKHFKLPPGIFDDFKPLAQHLAESAVERHEAEIQERQQGSRGRNSEEPDNDIPQAPELSGEVAIGAV